MENPKSRGSLLDLADLPDLAELLIAKNSNTSKRLFIPTYFNHIGGGGQFQKMTLFVENPHRGSNLRLTVMKGSFPRQCEVSNF